MTRHLHHNKQAQIIGGLPLGIAQTSVERQHGKLALMSVRLWNFKDGGS